MASGSAVVRQDRSSPCNCKSRSTHANLRELVFQWAATRRGFPALVMEFFAKSQRPVIFALPHYSALRSFVARNQALAPAIPATHDWPCKFRATGAQPASGRARFLLAWVYINKGGSCRGPCLETECARCMRRVRFRRRDLAGGILTSSGRRRRQTNTCRCETGQNLDTGERTSPVFCFLKFICHGRACPGHLA